MGYKVFASYKYADSSVQQLGHLGCKTTVRSYVDEFVVQLERLGGFIYKGEHDNEDLSECSDEFIWNELKDRIYDSSITVLFISPNMSESGKLEEDQWIPWEIEYSLREQTRDGRTSHANAIVAVILPNKNKIGQYIYRNRPVVFGPSGLRTDLSGFRIVESNIENGYIELVNWQDFIKNMNHSFENAIIRKGKIPPDKIVKSFDKSRELHKIQMSKGIYL